MDDAILQQSKAGLIPCRIENILQALQHEMRQWRTHGNALCAPAKRFHRLSCAISSTTRQARDSLSIVCEVTEFGAQHGVTFSVAGLVRARDHRSLRH